MSSNIIARVENRDLLWCVIRSCVDCFLFVAYFFYFLNPFFIFCKTLVNLHLSKKNGTDMHRSVHRVFIVFVWIKWCQIAHFDSKVMILHAVFSSQNVTRGMSKCRTKRSSGKFMICGPEKCVSVHCFKHCKKISNTHFT